MNRADYSNVEREMVNYLLGAMTEAARVEFETRYFADDELFEQLEIVKAELLDAYVRGQLSPDEQARFERHWLNSPPQRAQVAFARALKQQLAAPVSPPTEPTPARARPAWFGAWSPRTLIWSTAALLLLVAMGWLFRENRKLNTELAALRAEQVARRQQTQQIEDELAALRATAPVPGTSPTPSAAPAPPVPPPRFDDSIVAVTLSPATRSSAATPVRLAAGVKVLAVRLRLNFAPVLGSAYANLLAPDGARLGNYRRLRARRDQQGYFIDLRIAAPLLKAGEHQVTLFGRNAEAAEDVELDYWLRIVRP